MPKKIITITLNPALDKSSSTDHIIAHEKLRCDQLTYNPGGGGINVSRVLHRMDVAVETIYAEGGMNGKRITNLLQLEGIETRSLKTKFETRENFNVNEKSSKREFRFCMPGHELENGFYKKLFRIVEEKENKDIVIVSGSMPPMFPSYFFEVLSNICQKSKSKLIVDTSGEGLKSAMNHKLYLIKPNLEELKEYLGLKEIGMEDAILECRKIIENGKVDNIMLTNGADGAWWISKKIAYFIKTPIVNVKSTVGAGDSALAGAVFGIYKHYPIRKTLALGIAVGSATTLKEGTSLCEKKDVFQLFDSLNNEVRKTSSN